MYGKFARIYRVDRAKILWTRKKDANYSRAWIVEQMYMRAEFEYWYVSEVFHESFYFDSMTLNKTYVNAE